MEKKRKQSLARIIDRRSVDMTRGNIAPLLIQFAIPLLLGNVFQQLYNTVDTWVVGNFVSNAAFSAVGSVTPAINTLISFFTGLSTGATVVISQFFGAKRLDSVEKTVCTSVAVTFLLGIVLSVAGVMLIPAIMQWMKIPPDVKPEAIAYLTIFFGGLTGLLLYNMCAGIMRAVGDSVRPFLFLLITTVVNIVLDLVFVLRFQMGVRGVALATVIAQYLSAALVLLLLIRTNACVRLNIRKMRIDVDILRKVFKIGLPSAIQMMTMSFSNMFAYGYVNAFGADCMSGWTAYNKIDQFIALPIQSLSVANTTFTAQNVGKHDLARTKAGVRTAYAMALGITVLAIIPVTVFAPELVAFFNDRPEVISFGTRITRSLAPLYVINCTTVIFNGTLRGAGKTRVPTIIMFSTLVVLRQCYLFVMANYVSNTIVPIVMAFPVGWASCAICSYLYYRRAPLLGDAVVDTCAAAVGMTDERAGSEVNL